MIEKIGLRGQFHIQTYEGETLVESHVFKNRILRSGLVAVVTQGINLAAFDTFCVGSNGEPDSGEHAGVLSPLGSDRAGSRLADEEIPSWGFTTTYLPGEATGQWAEIGMRWGGVFLNRARFVNDLGNPITINKTALQRTIVTVIFNLQRV